MKEIVNKIAKKLLLESSRGARISVTTNLKHYAKIKYTSIAVCSQAMAHFYFNL